MKEIWTDADNVHLIKTVARVSFELRPRRGSKWFTIGKEMNRDPIMCRRRFDYLLVRWRNKYTRESLSEGVLMSLEEYRQGQLKSNLRKCQHDGEQEDGVLVERVEDAENDEEDAEGRQSYDEETAQVRLEDAEPIKERRYLEVFRDPTEPDVTLPLLQLLQVVPREGGASQPRTEMQSQKRKHKALQISTATIDEHNISKPMIEELLQTKLEDGTTLSRAWMGRMYRQALPHQELVVDELRQVCKGTTAGEKETRGMLESPATETIIKVDARKRMQSLIRATHADFERRVADAFQSSANDLLSLFQILLDGKVKA